MSHLVLEHSLKVGKMKAKQTKKGDRCFFFFFSTTLKHKNSLAKIISFEWIYIRCLRPNLLYLLLSGPHSEFTSGRCFHIQWRSLPQWEWCEHIGNRHILLMLSGGKTGLASAPQKAQGTQMKEIWTLCVCVCVWICAGCGHICMVSCACVFMLVCVYVQLCVYT